MKSIVIIVVLAPVLTAAISLFNVRKCNVEMGELQRKIEIASANRASIKYLVGTPRIECTFGRDNDRYPDWVSPEWVHQDTLVKDAINGLETTARLKSIWVLRSIASSCATFGAMCALAFFTIVSRSAGK